MHAPQPEAPRGTEAPSSTVLYKQVPFLILFHHNIQVMLMTQQDEKLISLWTIWTASIHQKTLYSYWTCTCFPPLTSSTLLSKPRNHFQHCSGIGHHFRNEAGHHPAQDMNLRLPPTGSCPLTWAYSFDSVGDYSLLEITKSQTTKFQFLRRRLTKQNPNRTYLCV